jgi:nitrite reductase/ring-hydroxylating ferredoxin subunit
MLTDEQKNLLRQTAKRTPMGDFLRRFWLPVATVAEVNDATRAKRVRVLSQPLVLFKDLAGRAALVPERCPHEGASMLMGAITAHGITCVLHGWRFDTEQMCSIWDDDSVWAEGYPAREHGGFYWAYLGDLPEPPLPAWPVPRRITQYPIVRSNWLLDVAPRLPSGRNWLLTPADREQTLVFTIENSDGDVEDVPVPEFDSESELALLPEGGQQLAAGVIPPWGECIAAGTDTSELWESAIAHLTARRDSEP